MKNTTIDVKTFKMFEKEKLVERVKEEDIGLDEAEKAVLINKLCPEVPYHS